MQRPANTFSGAASGVRNSEVGAGKNGPEIYLNCPHYIVSACISFPFISFPSFSFLPVLHCVVLSLRSGISVTRSWGAWGGGLHSFHSASRRVVLQTDSCCSEIRTCCWLLGSVACELFVLVTCSEVRRCGEFCVCLCSLNGLQGQNRTLCGSLVTTPHFV
jgi:hypothetical protein